MKTTILLLCAVLALVSAEDGKTCFSTGECEFGECCQSLLGPMVGVKSNVPGHCKPYIKRGQMCDIFANRNGLCSCEPWYKCALQDSINAAEISVQKRRLPQNRLGRCVLKPGFA
ncbi:hypothetical protein BsWGS_05805 [Bradybaena similaris]